MTTKTSDLLTTREAAEMLRRHPETVLRWARSGKLRSVKTASNSILFRRAHIEAFLAERTSPAPRRRKGAAA